MAISPALLTLAGGGAAAGALGRLAKNVYDVATEDTASGLPEPTKLVAPNAAIPVEVSPEEAEELRRRGLQVKKVMAKQALDLNTGDVLVNAGMGAAGLAGAYGGWKLVDKILGKSRRNTAMDERDAVKARIQKLLQDTPESADIPVHAAMKAAEAKYFEKTADAIVTPPILNTPLNTVVPLPAQWAIGAAGLASAVAAYNAMRSESRSKQKVDAIQSILKKSPAEPARAVLEPVEVVEKGGSPSQQAAG